MSLPYENATSGTKSIAEIEKILRCFGCNKFGTWQNYETSELMIQFEWRGRTVELRASGSGYAAAWLEENPWSTRRTSTELQYRQKALDKGQVAVYSILRDWVKAQVTAVETGVLTFEGVFMPHMLLPDGRRLLDRVDDVHKLLGHTNDS